MMDFEQYANLAKAKNKIKSNNKLAICLGISGSALNMFIKKKSTPSPETTLKLAKMAGYEEKEVILNLLIDRYKDSPSVQNVLIDIKNLTLK